MVAADYAFPDYVVRPGAVGKPLLGTDITIIDQGDQPVLPGAVGAVALRRGGKVLRTGDLGWLDADGYLCLKGRENDAIISAGYTIGAEEVEEALRLHPLVADAAVIARPDTNRGHVPRAFVELRSGLARPADDESLAAMLKDHVRAHLGRHAYPHDVIVVANLPRNENGKVAKARLRVLSG
jgi:acetyl-CoA synthetase